jgi:signal transduction histidine kinase
LNNLTETILTNLPSAVLVADINNKVVFANTAFGKLSGERHQDCIGKPLSEALSKLQEHGECLADEFSKSLNNIGEEKRLKTRKEKPTSDYDRDPLIAQSSGTSDFIPPSVISFKDEIHTYRIFDAGEDDEKGLLKGLILNDFTEEKNFLDRMTQAENISSLKTLAAGISHEIGNPLHSILTFSEAISEEQELDKIRHYAEKVAKNSTRLGKVLSDFSGYVQKVERGQKEKVSIVESIKTAIKFATLPYPGNKIILEEDYKSLSHLMAEPEDIQQIFFNIINNAFQAMKGNGKLKVSTQEKNNSQTIKFIDNGPGMPKDIARKALNPFFTTKMQGEGTGLGLNITQRLVEKYGGKIEIQSNVGEGTEVSVYFPNPTTLPIG